MESIYGDRVYTLRGIPMIHIQEVSKLIGMCLQGLRHLIIDGNVVRKMKSYRDKSRLMIPIAEIEGYPFIERGRQAGSVGVVIHHYRFNKQTGSFERYPCQVCSYTNDFCFARQRAEELNVPEGDK